MTHTEKIYSQILDRILSGQIHPGDWIDRNQIANNLGVSIAPVKDAIDRLTLEGFLITVRRRGTQVKTPRPEEVFEQLLLREALECQAVRSFTSKIKNNYSELMTAAKLADKITKNPRDAWKNDLNFHMKLVGTTECKALIRMFAQTMNLTFFQFTGLFTPYPMNQSDKHSQMLDCLVEASPDDAEKRIRKHIRTGKSNFREFENV